MHLWAQDAFKGIINYDDRTALFEEVVFSPYGKWVKLHATNIVPLKDNNNHCPKGLAG